MPAGDSETTMPYDLDGITDRIEWLEKAFRRLLRLLGNLRDEVDEGKQDRQRPRRDDRAGEIVIVRPLAEIGVATFTEADVGPPYVPATIVPATGDAIIWQDYEGGSPGEMWATRYVQRWEPEPEPGAYVDEEAVVEVDNFNARDAIPADAHYIVCVRRPNGRLKALVWDCGATA